MHTHELVIPSHNTRSCAQTVWKPTSASLSTAAAHSTATSIINSNIQPTTTNVLLESNNSVSRPPYTHICRHDIHQSIENTHRHSSTQRSVHKHFTCNTRTRSTHMHPAHLRPIPSHVHVHVIGFPCASHAHPHMTLTVLCPPSLSVVCCVV